jgi:hypothetical protein
MKNKWIRLFLLGMLIWIVPFVSAFAFYDSSGNLSVSYDLFKSSMIVVSSLTASYALLRYFQHVFSDFIREGALTGFFWLAINLVLDIVILVPFAKMAYKDYFSAIGLRYLQIPIFCLMAGFLLHRKSSTIEMNQNKL